MHWVIIWLSLASFLALVPTYRLSLWFGTWLWRWGHPWFALAILLLLCDAIDPFEGHNDPNAPLEVISRMVKLAWYAGIAASLPGRGQLLSMPLLVWLHISAVGFAFGVHDMTILYSEPVSRMAWLGEAITIFESYIQLAWVPLWGDTTNFPNAIAMDILVAPAQWAVPLVIVGLLAWCWCLQRSATLNVAPEDAPAPLALRPLPIRWVSVIVVLWIAAQSLGDTMAAVICSDLARLGWLIHCLGTIRALFALRQYNRILIATAVMSLVFLDGILLLVGCAGIIMSGWGMKARDKATSWDLRPITAWTTIGISVVLFIALRAADIKTTNPINATPTYGQWIDTQASATAKSANTAEKKCRYQGARLCTASEWKSAMAARSSMNRSAPGNQQTGNTQWEWVWLETLGQQSPGIARTFDVAPPESFVAPGKSAATVTAIAISASLKDDVGVESIRYRCCR